MMHLTLSANSIHGIAKLCSMYSKKRDKNHKLVFLLGNGRNTSRQESEGLISRRDIQYNCQLVRLDITFQDSSVGGWGSPFTLYQMLTLEMLDDGRIWGRCLGCGPHGLGLGKLLFTN